MDVETARETVRGIFDIELELLTEGDEKKRAALEKARIIIAQRFYIEDWTGQVEVEK